MLWSVDVKSIDFLLQLEGWWGGQCVVEMPLKFEIISISSLNLIMFYNILKYFQPTHICLYKNALKIKNVKTRSKYVGMTYNSKKFMKLPIY